MHETMPLDRTHMYDYGCHLTKGCCCMYALSHFHHIWLFCTNLCHTHFYYTAVSQVYQWILTMIIPLRGGRMDRSREINYPSLGFHETLDMRDTSSVGRIHSCVLDKVEGTAQNKLPQFRVLLGFKPANWLKMASTS